MGGNLLLLLGNLLGMGGSAPAIVSGVTRDCGGAPLGSCLVKAFATSTNTFLGSTTSDAGGNYALTVPAGMNVYLVGYKAGAPDMAGTTRDDIQGA
jgi:hypothetical protein